LAVVVVVAGLLVLLPRGAQVVEVVLAKTLHLVDILLDKATPGEVILG
jgi:hypothetical protein